MKLALATRNKGKIAELRALLAPLGIGVVTFEDLGEAPWPEVLETGQTFSENAARKATAVAQATGLWSLADDSGLEVTALGGLPGVRSARFDGDGATDEENNEKLLRLLRDVPAGRKQARFVSVVAVAPPGGAGECRLFAGECAGRIADLGRGERGFGYDPLFVPDEGNGKTFAELSDEEKNQISHRARAVLKAMGFLRELAKETSQGGFPSGGVPRARVDGGADVGYNK